MEDFRTQFSPKWTELYEPPSLCVFFVVVKQKKIKDFKTNLLFNGTEFPKTPFNLLDTLLIYEQ